MLLVGGTTETSSTAAHRRQETHAILSGDPPASALALAHQHVHRGLQASLHVQTPGVQGQVGCTAHTCSSSRATVVVAGRSTAKDGTGMHVPPWHS